MNDTLDVGRELFIWADQHRQSLFVAALGVSVLLLIWAVRKAVKSGRPDKWLTIMSVLLGFAWSAEAMWEIATEKLHLPVTFAAGTFIVFELMLAVAMMRAERSQSCEDTQASTAVQRGSSPWSWARSHRFRVTASWSEPCVWLCRCWSRSSGGTG